MALELPEESRKASRTGRKSPLQDKGIFPGEGPYLMRPVAARPG
jgi:hypothetical protein